MTKTNLYHQWTGMVAKELVRYQEKRSWAILLVSEWGSKGCNQREGIATCLERSRRCR